jgi:cobalamin biosynthesis Mg chelatase CobN
MVEKSGSMTASAARSAKMRAMLDAAAFALEAGEAADAERQAKAISALVRAEGDVAKFLAEQRASAPEQNDEELRAELRRRIGRYVGAAAAGAPLEALDQIAAGSVAQ